MLNKKWRERWRKLCCWQAKAGNKWWNAKKHGTATEKGVFQGCGLGEGTDGWWGKDSWSGRLITLKCTQKWRTKRCRQRMQSNGQQEPPKNPPRKCQAHAQFSAPSHILVYIGLTHNTHTLSPHTHTHSYTHGALRLRQKVPQITFKWRKS